MRRQERVFFAFLWLAIVLSLAGGAYGGDRAGKQECVEKVDQAAQMIEKKGLPAVLEMIRDKKGSFVWKDSYLFCIDSDEARLLAHPFLPERMQGISLIATVDVREKLYFKDFVDIAGKQGSGWVTYVHMGRDGVLRYKETYVLKVRGENAILGAGYYNDEKVVPLEYKIPEMDLADVKGKKAALIISNKGFDDAQFNITGQLLEKAGAEVALFAADPGEAVGMYGKKVVVPQSLKNLKVGDFDAIVFLGGSGAKDFHDDPTAHDVVKEAVKQGKILAALGWAPVILAKAGVIKGKMVAAHSYEAGWFKENGFLYTGDKMTVDGRLITANGPSASVFFSKAVIESLNLLPGPGK